MRRNKAINGLKHCASGLGCYGCPYSEGHESTSHCQLDNARDALEVIREQKTTIERLRYNLDAVLSEHESESKEKENKRT